MVCYFSEELHAFQMLHHVNTAEMAALEERAHCTLSGPQSVCLPKSGKYTILPCQPPSLLSVFQNTGQSLSHHHPQWMI